MEIVFIANSQWPFNQHYVCPIYALKMVTSSLTLLLCCFAISLTYVSDIIMSLGRISSGLRVLQCRSTVHK